MKIKSFWADRSGAVLSEFVVLSAALVLGVSTAMATLTSSLGMTSESLSSEISVIGVANCPEALRVSASGTGALAKTDCR